MGVLGAATCRASPRVMHGSGQGHGNRTAPERALSSRDMYTAAARTCARGAASREETRPPEGIEPPLRGHWAKATSPPIRPERFWTPGAAAAAPQSSSSSDEDDTETSSAARNSGRRSSSAGPK